MQDDSRLTASGVLIEADLHVTPAHLRGVAGARRGTATHAMPVVIGICVALREVASGTPTPGIANDTMSGQELLSNCGLR